MDINHEIIGQVLGIMATAITFVSYQLNKKGSLLVAQTAATLCTCISYFFLGASEGFALNIVCIVRNISFYYSNNKKATRCIAFFCAAVMCALGAITWQGLVSLLLILALTANTLILSLGRPQVLRQSILFTSSAILIYNIIVFSIGGVANEALSIISSIIGIIRFKRRSSVIDA